MPVMAQSLRSRVELRQRFPQQPAGSPRDPGPDAASMPLAKDSLSPFWRGTTCRWMWNTLWNAALPSLMAMLLPSACSPDCRAALGDAMADARQAGDGVRRRIGQVDGVALGDHQGVAAGERADVEDGQVVVVLVDPDRGSLTGDDGAEHTGHPATLAAQPPTFSLAHSAMRRSRSSGETSSTRVITVQRWPNGSRIDAKRSPVTNVCGVRGWWRRPVRPW